MAESCIKYDIFSQNYLAKRRNSSSSTDRFIPRRRNSDFDAANFRLNSSGQEEKARGRLASTVSSTSSPVFGSGNVNRKSVGRQGRCYSDDKILAFSPDTCGVKDPVADIMQRFKGVCFTPSGNGSSAHSKRYIQKTPETILDMPGLPDHFLCHVLAVSSASSFGVAIDGSLYTYNSQTGFETTNVFEEDPSEQEVPAITSVTWDSSGKKLMLGQHDGDVKIWDLEKNDVSKISGPCPHKEMANCLISMGNGQLLISGHHDCGCIRLHDLRSSDVTSFYDGEKTFSSAQRPLKELCNMKASTDGRYLVAGGAAGCLDFWSIKQRKMYQNIEAHDAPIRALAWSPWQSNMMASGGGFTDGNIRCWNVNTGKKVAEVATESEVCSMVWSPEHHELATGHGGANTDIALWHFPGLEPVARLSNHSGRVLYLDVTPGENSLVSASGEDETLVTWSCFEGMQKPRRRSSCAMSSPLAMTIR